MNHRLFVSLSLLLICLAACQPIRPVSDPGPNAPLPTSTAGRATITETTTITTATGPAITSTTSTITSTTSSATAITATTPATTSAAASGTIAPPPSAGAIATCPVMGEQSLNLVVEAMWQTGDLLHYSVLKNRSDIMNGEEYPVPASKTPLTITVTSADSSGSILEWEFGKTTLATQEDGTPNPVEAFLSLPPELRLSYTTDESGAYLELNNPAALQAGLLEFFEGFYDGLLEAGETDAAVIDVARQQTELLINDPDNFETLFGQEIQLFHTLYGLSLESSEVVTRPDVRINPLGGAPIPGELTITPSQYDSDQGCLQVVFENVADPVATRNSIMEALQKQAQQMGVPGPTEADLPQELELVDTITVTMDLNTGWPTSVSMQRLTMLGTQGRIETTSITLDTAP